MVPESRWTILPRSPSVLVMNSPELWASLLIEMISVLLVRSCPLNGPETIWTMMKTPKSLTRAQECAAQLISLSFSFVKHVGCSACFFLKAKYFTFQYLWSGILTKLLVLSHKSVHEKMTIQRSLPLPPFKLSDYFLLRFGRHLWHTWIFKRLQHF